MLENRLLPLFDARPASCRIADLSLSMLKRAIAGRSPRVLPSAKGRGDWEEETPPPRRLRVAIPDAPCHVWSASSTEGDVEGQFCSSQVAGVAAILRCRSTRHVSLRPRAGAPVNNGVVGVWGPRGSTLGRRALLRVAFLDWYAASLLISRASPMRPTVSQ